jgi:hypothetical protein
MIKIDKYKFANEEIYKTKWDFSNKLLYDLCEKYPKHDNIEIILTKILFIGRIYAASIERRKNKTDIINDDFYIKEVVPKIKDSKLDSILQNIDENSNVINILKLHKYLSDLFKELTNLNKRSLSSKYLHFHKPNIFFMYDSRVSDALKEFKFDNKEINNKLKDIKSENIDLEYSKFYFKMNELKDKIEKSNNISLTIRNFDTLLINIGNIKLKNKSRCNK